jgi:hypothetical protein
MRRRRRRKKRRSRRRRRRRRRRLLISKLKLNVRKKLVKCHICGTSWALRKVYHQYLRSFEK